MPKTTDPWLVPSEYGPCACTQLRRAARRVSSLYDRALQSAGLTVTQYALLVYVARARRVGRTALATQLGMDRTTLTRNLFPLEKAALLVTAEGVDRRERLICLSAKGRRKLKKSYNLWADTQKLFSERIGPTALTQFRNALTSAEAAAGHFSDPAGLRRAKANEIPPPAKAEPRPRGRFRPRA